MGIKPPFGPPSTSYSTTTVPCTSAQLSTSFITVTSGDIPTRTDTESTTIIVTGPTDSLTSTSTAVVTKTDTVTSVVTQSTPGLTTTTLTTTSRVAASSGFIPVISSPPGAESPASKKKRGVQRGRRLGAGTNPFKNHFLQNFQCHKHEPASTCTT